MADQKPLNAGGRAARLGLLLPEPEFPVVVPRECPVDGLVFVGRRNKRYCSKRCARKAARQRREWHMRYML